jgi:hypothetical protein
MIRAALNLMRHENVAAGRDVIGTSSIQLCLM